MQRQLTRKKIKLKSIKMAYYDEGAGTPIILLHGFPDSADVWRNIAPILIKDGYRIIAPDLRGFGESEAPIACGSYKIKYLMQDIIELKKSLALDGPIKLVGHDWGSLLGWCLITFYPEHFSSFVPLCVGHPRAYLNDGGFEQQQKGWYTMAFQTAGFAEKMFSQNDWAVLRLFSENNPEVDSNWIPDLSRPGRFTAALNLYRANLKPQKIKVAFPPTQVPVFGIFGKDDLYLSEAQMAASGKHVGGNFSWEAIKGGHWLPLEKPELVAELITNFYALPLPAIKHNLKTSEAKTWEGILHVAKKITKQK